MVIGILAISAFVVLLGGMIAGSYFLDIYTATQTAQSIEDARTVALQQQQRAGAVLGEKLCDTFGRLAALKPPAGDPARNPSRAFDDSLHMTLDQLGTDLGCKVAAPPKGA
jgi:hypothetical protein